MLLEMKFFKNLAQPNSLKSTSILATNSAFVVDKVTIACFLDDHKTATEPNMKTYLEVFTDRLSPHHNNYQ